MNIFYCTAEFFECNDCGHKSKTLQNHKNHLTVHSSERKEKCDCGATFKTRQCLLQHKRICKSM